MAAVIVQKVLAWIWAGWSEVLIPEKAKKFFLLPKRPHIQWVQASFPGSKPVGKG